MSTVITEHIRPPVPSTQYDWAAHVEGEEESGPAGRGPTEVAALRDLAEQLAELWLTTQTGAITPQRDIFALAFSAPSFRDDELRLLLAKIQMLAAAWQDSPQAMMRRAQANVRTIVERERANEILTNSPNPVAAPARSGGSVL